MEGMVKLKSEFYKGKRVFITGHTGFKGIWLCRMLVKLGADITGYSLPAPTAEGARIFDAIGLEKSMHSIVGDIRDYASLKKAFDEAHPEIVIHLAAQPIVRESYRDPVGTYETNVMGTVHILECIRHSACVHSFLNVTTDKVYKNNEWEWGYRENEPLDGFDPYSNSKSCSELVTHSYKNSFFAEGIPAISTARAGNVIGGGDFATDRIIPDCVRAAYENKNIKIRNPHSARPYQHVLEPLYAYLMIIQAQYEDKKYAGWYNVGPDESDCVTNEELCNFFCEAWRNGLVWENISDDGPHEANILRLDSSKLKYTFGWKPRWNIREAVCATVEWAKAWKNNENIRTIMDSQIEDFINGGRI